MPITFEQPAFFGGTSESIWVASDMRVGTQGQRGESGVCTPVKTGEDSVPRKEGTLAMASYIGAIDQGTTSSRFIVFDRSGRIVCVAQKEHEQIYPKPGWVEHDPEEIWNRIQDVIREAMEAGRLRPGDLAAIGVTNQRETTVVWNKKNGKPVYNAIVWQDTRVAPAVAEFAARGGQDRYRAQTGLPLATYFSGLKIR